MHPSHIAVVYLLILQQGCSATHTTLSISLVYAHLSKL